MDPKRCVWCGEMDDLKQMSVNEYKYLFCENTNCYDYYCYWNDNTDSIPVLKNGFPYFYNEEKLQFYNYANDEYSDYDSDDDYNDLKCANCGDVNETVLDCTNISYITDKCNHHSFCKNDECIKNYITYNLNNNNDDDTSIMPFAIKYDIESGILLKGESNPCRVHRFYDSCLCNIDAYGFPMKQK